MDNHSDGDDISESEMPEYAEKCYVELKKGKQRLKTSDQTFTCPYCSKGNKKDYKYVDLLQHASGVGNSTSDKRTSKEKASHIALARFLEKDLPAMGSSSKPVVNSCILGSCSNGQKSISPKGTQNGTTMDQQVELNDSEMHEYEEKCYQDLKNGNLVVQNPDQTFACPYCPKKRKRDYLYNELLQHASGVGNSPSDKRDIRQKVTHMALTKYLENDLAHAATQRGPGDKNDPFGDCGHDEKFVWPWTGIVVNIPTTKAQDGRFVGASGSKFRDELISRGFNPTRVFPLWNFKGHSGTAVVEFKKDWPGLHNAISFEKAYEADHHGKKDWLDTTIEKSGLYCWVARADDYNANNIIGEHLRKIGDLKTISGIMQEEARKQDKLVSNLTNIIETKKRHLIEMEQRCSETSITLNKVIDEKDRLLQAYNEEIRKIQVSARDHFKKILGDHEKLKMQLETQKKELEVRGVELEQREAKNENDRKWIVEDLEKLI